MGPSPSGVKVAAVAASPMPKSAPSIYTANPPLNSLSIFSVGSSGNVPSRFTQTFLSSPSGIAYWKGKFYVANSYSDSITVYPADATSRPNPVFTISGGNTELHSPLAIVLDSAGTIYVVNEGLNGYQTSVTIYAAGTKGNAAPKAVIKGAKTGLQSPNSVGVDSQGNVYVANEGTWSGSPGKIRISVPSTITVYSPSSSGDIRPTRIISGAATNLKMLRGLAVDAAGYLYASCDGLAPTDGTSILIFAPGSAGSVAPAAIVDGGCAGLQAPGPLTLDSSGRLYALNPVLEGLKVVAFDKPDLKLNQPQCLTPTAGFFVDKSGETGAMAFAVDDAGNVFVTNNDASSLMIFRLDAGEDAGPFRTFDGKTGLLNPTGVALDASGKIYVVNDGVASGNPDRITVYPSGSDADVAPIATISGSPNGIDGLSDPQAIVASPDGTIFVANATSGYKSHGTITVYAPGATGEVQPIRTISGTNDSDQTGLDDPIALAIDSAQNLYVLNSGLHNNGAGSIRVYSPTANGNVSPIRTIANDASGPKTHFQSPVGMALDSAGKIYVTNDGSIGGKSDSITIYAAGVSGNAAPTAIVAGSNTGLRLPQGIAVDSTGRIYVANDGNGEEENAPADPADSVTVYAPNSSGNVAPIAKINGSLTGLGHPRGIAVGP